jgi:hypothetical protein
MKIIVTSPVEHDGKALVAGAEVDLPEQVAEALVAAGSAEVKAPATKAKAKTAEAPTE